MANEREAKVHSRVSESNDGADNRTGNENQVTSKPIDINLEKLEVFILPRNAAIGIYENLKASWLNREIFYEETKTALTKIREQFNLD